MVPHLTTALSGPINELEQRVLESMPAIERWFRLEWMEHTPTFYASVDLRNAGYKLAPVDTNLFPAGFNHLSEEVLPLAVQAAMAAIEKICPEAKNLLLVVQRRQPDSFYLSHLLTLVRIFTMAGLNVRLGTLDETVQEAQTLRLADGRSLQIEPVLRQRSRIGLKDFDPCTILLNDDLSAGIPDRLRALHEQYLLPPLHAGWPLRRKRHHQQAYEEVCKRFAKLLGMDPWLLVPATVAQQQVDLNQAQHVQALQAQVDVVLSRTRRKFKDYGIQENAFVAIKPDAASCSDCVLMVRDAKDLPEILARHGASTRLPQGPCDLIVQEGIPSYERIHDTVAEPVVCLMDRFVVGGYYRVHAGRQENEALNVPGARYVPLAFAQGAQLPRPGETPGVSAPNRFYMYGVVARLAMLAASYELEATDPEAEEL
ncbi:glutamate--cysteine ligase [Roseateles sp. BYS180W]|uniref:Glutamate--cysteine ligase n=1 Tax=Roseateles rivi TaxID=3299028 RepID=A0ABW7FQQ3_9BURK